MSAQQERIKLLDKEIAQALKDLTEFRSKPDWGFKDMKEYGERVAHINELKALLAKQWSKAVKGE